MKRRNEHKSDCYLVHRFDSDTDWDKYWNKRPIEDALRTQLAEAKEVLARIATGNESRVAVYELWAEQALQKLDE